VYHIGVARTPESDVLVLHLSQYHSLDVVRLLASQKYRVVFAERWGVQRRAFVEISFEQALAIARFLANIGVQPADPNESPTNPGRPIVVPPPPVQEVIENGIAWEVVDVEAVPETVATDVTSPIDSNNRNKPE